MSYTHADLVEIGREWLNHSWRNATDEGHGRCFPILTELRCITTSAETPDVIGWTRDKSVLHSALWKILG
jgi:hypothetical protein